MKLYKNKKGLKFENIFIALLVFSLFIVGGIAMMADLNKHYGEFGVNLSTDKFNIDEFNTIEEIHGITRGADEKTFQGDISDTDSADSVIRGVYSTLRTATRSYSMIRGIMTAVALEVGVPTIIVTAAFSAIVLTIIFSVVYLVFRFKP